MRELHSSTSNNKQEDRQRERESNDKRKDMSDKERKTYVQNITINKEYAGNTTIKPLSRFRIEFSILEDY